jgi:hypothetical protein
MGQLAHHGQDGVYWIRSFARRSDISNGTFGSLVDAAHYWHLTILLWDISLVDAKSVNPQGEGLAFGV